MTNALRRIPYHPETAWSFLPHPHPNLPRRLLVVTLVEGCCTGLTSSYAATEPSQAMHAMPEVFRKGLPASQVHLVLELISQYPITAGLM
jgi:hypothetical protein